MCVCMFSIPDNFLKMYSFLEKTQITVEPLLVSEQIKLEEKILEFGGNSSLNSLSFFKSQPANKVVPRLTLKHHTMMAIIDFPVVGENCKRFISQVYYSKKLFNSQSV